MKRFIILSMLFISGCTSTVMNGIMSSWEGSHIHEAGGQWGYPTYINEYPNENVYIWDYSKSVNIPQRTNFNATVVGNTITGTATSYGGGTFHGGCRRVLITDKKDIVQTWMWNGNNCPFIEAMEYSKWRKRIKSNE